MVPPSLFVSLSSNGIERTTRPRSTTSTDVFSHERVAVLLLDPPLDEFDRRRRQRLHRLDLAPVHTPPSASSRL